MSGKRHCVGQTPADFAATCVLEDFDVLDVLPETIGYLAVGLLYQFLWIAYFMKSTRVRETFVIPRGGHSSG